MAMLMSAANPSLQAASSIVRRSVNAFSAWRAEQRQRNEIARELASYSSRELQDLRIDRADFPAIINGTYRR